MRLHDKGVQADRDRAILLASYEAMCKEFHTPTSKRLTPVDIAKMTNTQLYQASKDLYNSQTVTNAKRLSYKLGLSRKPEPWLIRVLRYWTQTPTHLDESNSKKRYEAQG